MEMIPFDRQCAVFRQTQVTAHNDFASLAPDVETHEPFGETPSVIPAETRPVLAAAALHGLAGEVVRLIEPCTEADPVALLVSFLSEAGTMLNRGPHLILDGTYHPLLIWPVLVG